MSQGSCGVKYVVNHVFRTFSSRRRTDLAGDGELVANLTLARSELAVELGDRASLDSA
jgi:hypothetical protein